MSRPARATSARSAVTLEAVGTPPTEREERLNAALSTLQRQNSTLRQTVSIYDQLGSLVLQGKEVGAITQVLGELLDRRVLLLDSLLKPMAGLGGIAPGLTPDAEGWAPTHEYVSRVLATLADERRPLRVPSFPDWGVAHPCALVPVVVGDGVIGYLAILEGNDTDSEVELLAAQHAATICALALMREQIAAEVTGRLRDELLEGLLRGDLDEQASQVRASYVGYRPGSTYRALVLTPEDTVDRGTWSESAMPARLARRRRVLEGLATLVASRAPEAITSVRGEHLVILMPEDGANGAHGRQPSAAELGRAATLHVSTLFSSWRLTVGIGGRAQSAMELSRSYSEAQRAVDTARRFGRLGEVVPFEELGFYRLLHQVSDPNELRSFVDQTLGQLVEYDRKHHAEFVATLAAYLSNNMSVQGTAGELTLHVNTVRYRLQRIRAITGLELDSAEDRFLAQVALKILGALDQV